MKNYIRLFLVGFLFCFSSPLYSQYSTTYTRSAATPPKGYFAISLGIDYEDIDDGDITTISLTPVWGIFENLEIDLFVPYVFQQEDIDGVGDLEVSLSWEVISEQEKIPAISISPAVKLDTGDEEEGLGTGGTDWDLSISLSKEFGRFIPYLSLGYTWVETEGEGDTLHGTIAGDYAFTDPFHIIVELDGETTIDSDDDDNSFSLSLDLVYHIIENWILDGGISLDLEDISEYRTYFLNITYEF